MRSKSVVSMLALAVLPGLAACQVSSGDSASGGDYPGDTIEIIVGTSAGGPTDTNTRVLATCMEKDLGQTIVVKNVDGASGAMGNRELISAKADGYTLSLTPATGLVLSPYLDDLGFSHEDVTPIGRLFATTMVFVTKDSYKNGEEFFADAKKNPGKITVGTPGPTSPKSVVMEALRDNHDIDLKPVPLDGDAGVVTAMLGNNIDVAAVEATETLKAYIASGELTALAYISPGTVPWLEGVPTLEDLGYADAMLPNNEYPLYGPKGLSDDVVETLEASMKACVESSEVVETIGEDYITKPFQGGEATATWLDESSETYKGIVE
ncbi:tripartite tricarboxylate transporter substrate binding protein [Nocardioides jensenii]|uniref:tripartite tricarboxylate transporter substrate binding protein n=1 Tax=Nocardioides jensenii TaxID=1843 RepID=UPI00082E651B|nr:tripartite tricarboxylate transporter substrate binding protein [Nocardioides jensenii]